MTGKSTLLNALLNEEKAIVSDIHGTTRDVIEDTINLQGVTFRFIDTAGIRQTNDAIEKSRDRTYFPKDGPSICHFMDDRLYRCPKAVRRIKKPTFFHTAKGKR